MDNISFGITTELTGNSYQVNAVAFSPDGKQLASGSGDRRVKIWSVEEG